MIEIVPTQLTDHRIELPGSKSYTHRAIIAAALSNGSCRVTGGLDSEDTRLTRKALKMMGIAMEADGGIWQIEGADGCLQPCAEPIHLQNSGTSMRLLTAVAAMGQGEYLLTGTGRMQQRPMGHLLAALKQAGCPARAVHGNDCPPVVIPGGTAGGGRVEIDCSVSSQYLSGLLLLAPRVHRGMQIQVTRGPVSKSYIDLTLDMLQRFGVEVQRDGYRYFDVPGGQTYQAHDLTVEPDASNAGYFWAAAAVSGGSVTVKGLTLQSLQGDVRFVRVLEKMGCRLEEVKGEITVTGGPLSGIEVDMAHMPDLVPTLAIVAAFAKGATRIVNVAHLRAKECDRLAATVEGLLRMGIRAAEAGDTLTIVGGRPHGATIDTHDDHRMAMSFAVAGVKIPGVMIKGEDCVEKSFPKFWDVFNQLYR